MNAAELDRAWEDVLRRARRPRVSRRVVAVAAVVVAVATAGPALGVLLTRPGPPALPADQIGDNKVTTVVVPTTRMTMLEYARWQGHDGVCYLVPHVHAGCLLTGESSRRFRPVPRFIAIPPGAATGSTLVIRHGSGAGFHVLALPGGKAKIVSP